jgi:hypothetical protein
VEKNPSANHLMLMRGASQGLRCECSNIQIALALQEIVNGV